MVNARREAHKEKPIQVREKSLAPLVRRQWKKILRLMVVYPGDIILDANCMEGTLLKRLARLHPQAALCGACYTPPQVRYARQLAQGADVMFADDRDLPWMSESMDVAFIARGFHEMDNPPAVLYEIHRLLRKGGQVLIAGLWVPRGICSFANELIEHTHPARIRTQTEMIEMLRSIGFEQVHYERVGTLGCVLTGLKK